MRLTWKLTLAIALGIVSVLTLSAWLRIRADADAYHRDTLRDHYVVGRGLATAVELLWAREGEERALELVRLVNDRENRIGIRWVWPDEQSGPSAPRSRAGLPGPRDAVRSTEVRPDGEPSYIVTYVPVHLHAARDGAIELSESSADEHELVRGALLRSAGTTFLLILICSALILLFGVVFLARPMKLLVQKANAIGAGDLDSPLVVTQRDEIFDLAEAMNTMCERLKDARDETRREAEAKELAVDQLRHADRLRTIGELSTGLAHELGAPLNVVRVRAAMIGSGEVSENRMRELGTLIVDQADRVSAIIRQLLDFARREAPERRLVDLRSVLRDAVLLVSPLAESTGVVVQIGGKSERVSALVDSAQLQQAVANILLNAIHASSRGDVVSVLVSCEPTPTIAVRDSGKGIAPEHLPRIFEPFFTTKAAGVGTGLGLSVTLGIIEEHGGTVRVESSVGVGTTFTIELLAPEASQSPTAPDFAAAPASSRR
ncbi:MAG TPA: HAMP domain-containing sensor histidine kinase [Polyangiaceae bacterium]|nr:HAMP domain-containing sensor histidine kinase [Polyangiaceae bacterium]